MKNKSSKKTNDLDTVSSNLIESRIDLQELSELWRRFVYMNGGLYSNDKSMALEMILERKIIREGIKNKTLQGDIHQYDVKNRNLLWQSRNPPRIVLSDGETVASISDEFRAIEIEPMVRRIECEQRKQLEKIANTIYGNEFETIRITAFIRQNGRIIDDEEYE